MISAAEIPGQIHRVDPLIGCGNLLGFTELLERHFGQEPVGPFTLLSLDVNSFSQVNARRGHAGGDAALRWIGFVLEEETGGPVFRLGGDELVCVFEHGTPEEHSDFAWRIFGRLNREALKFGLGVPAASISVIHYTGEENVDPAGVFIHLSAAILEVKKKSNKSFKIFQAGELAQSVDPEHLRWLANGMIDRIIALGAMLDESNRLAFTDPVTGLPNMRAVQQQLEITLAQASALNQAVSILMVDGDDLRKYNAINYAAGDEMIRRLGETLSANLRPGDFLARWRVGDEFLIILPGAPVEQARMIGDRLCRAVTDASQGWQFPVTISVGVASAPPSSSPADLLDEVEMANKKAKELGKNQVCVRPQAT